MHQDRNWPAVPDDDELLSPLHPVEQVGERGARC